MPQKNPVCEVLETLKKEVASSNLDDKGKLNASWRTGPLPGSGPATASPMVAPTQATKNNTGAPARSSANTAPSSPSTTPANNNTSQTPALAANPSAPTPQSVKISVTTSAATVIPMLSLVAATAPLAYLLFALI